MIKYTHFTDKIELLKVEIHRYKRIFNTEIYFWRKKNPFNKVHVFTHCRTDSCILMFSFYQTLVLPFLAISTTNNHHLPVIEIRKILDSPNAIPSFVHCTKPARWSISQLKITSSPSFTRTSCGLTRNRWYAICSPKEKKFN